MGSGHPTMVQTLLPHYVPIVQDDNAPVHTSKQIGWFPKHHGEVKLLPWSQQLLDIS